MVVGRLRGTVLGALGVVVLFQGVGRAVFTGVIDIGKNQSFQASFKHDPLIFIVALVIEALLAAGCIAVAWKAWKDEAESTSQS